MRSISGGENISKLSQKLQKAFSFLSIEAEMFVALIIKKYLVKAYFFAPPECALKVLVGENSPSLCPTMSSLTKTG